MPEHIKKKLAEEIATLEHELTHELPKELKYLAWLDLDSEAGQESTTGPKSGADDPGHPSDPTPDTAPESCRGWVAACAPYVHGMTPTCTWFPLKPRLT